MDKKGMRRPDPSDPHGTESDIRQHFERNEVSPVPELQGKAKHTKEKAEPVRYDGKKHTTFSDDQ